MAEIATTLVARRIWVAVGIVVLLVGGGIAVWTARKHVHVERDGWVLDYSHKRFFCNVCTASLNYVRCNGEDVPAPWATGHAPERGSVTLHTPVGELLFHSQEGKYRPWHSYSMYAPDSDEEITPEELLRGYYDTDFGPATTSQSASGLSRKRGTPAYWCIGDSGTYVRWLDPRMIDKLEW